MPGTEHGLRIVDLSGNQIVAIDGNDNGIISPRGFYYPDEMKVEVQLRATSVTSYISFINHGVWQVQRVLAGVSTNGGAGATAQITHCVGATAPGSGTVQLAAAIDLNAGTPPYILGAAPIASPTKYRPGDSMGLLMAGTLTALVGALTVYLKRIE